jgi:cytochrome P450
MGFDPGDPMLITDPERVFRQLRVLQPACAADIGGHRTIVVSRHRDVGMVLSDPTARVRAEGYKVETQLGEGPGAELWNNAVSMMDPPEHSRVRRCLAKDFTRRQIESMRPLIVNVVRQTLADIEADEIDAVRQISIRIPMKVICLMLGIPESDWQKLEAWTVDFLKIFMPHIASSDELEAVNSASQNFIEYFSNLIEQKRANPGKDLTSTMALLEGTEGNLSKIEIIGALRGLLTAGFETTAATLSATVLAYARYPAEFDKIRNGSASASHAAEELLRWESPVQAVTRYSGRDFKLHSELISAGTPIMALIGSANNDPEHFGGDACDINFSRERVDHLSFGGGRHFCLGASLARLELQVFLEEMVTSWCNVSINEESIVRREQFQFRSINSLPAKITLTHGSLRSPKHNKAL